MKYVEVQNGKVVSTSGFPQANHIEAPDWVQGGDTFDGTLFVAQSLPLRAKISTKNAQNVETTMFGDNEAITVKVEILTESDAIYTAFAGTFAVPFFVEGGRKAIINLTFAAGVATKTIPAGKLQPGEYSATAQSSKLVRVIPHTITIGI